MPRLLRRTGWRGALAWSILTLQAVSVLHARFDDGRYFCWAPHDSQNEYAISVSIDGRPLTAAEVERRYRIPARGVDPRAIAHVTRLVDQYERTVGAEDDAEVTVRYRVNGGPVHHWRPDR